jgi:hypothetical protein
MGEIAQRLGVRKTTVCRLITQHGMPMLAALKRKKRSSGKSKYEARNLPSRLGSQPAPRTARWAPSLASPPSGSAR